MNSNSPFTDQASREVERNPARALARADEALEAQPADASRERRAEIQLDRGRALVALGRYRDAREAFGESEGRLGESIREALGEIGRAEAVWVLGEHEEARRYAEMARTRLEALGDELGLAWVDVTLANMHHHNLDGTGVNEVFDRSRAVLLRLGAEVRAARADVSCANALTYQGRHGAALERYERARRVFQEAGISRRMAICDLNRAIVHQMRGELREAVQAGESAREVFQAEKLQTYQAFAETNLSEVLLDLNRNQEALAMASSATRHYAAEEMEYDRSIVAINLARAMARTGDAAGARRELMQAGDFFRAEGSHIYSGLVETDLAVLDLQRGDALAATERARAARKTLSSHGTYAAYALLVEARATEYHDPDAALALNREALESDEMRELIWLQYRSRHRASILLAQAGHLREARVEADRAVRLIEEARAGLAGDLAKTAFLDDKEEAFRGAVRLHLEAADHEAALRAIEAAKSAALVELLSARASGDAAQPGLQGEAAKTWKEFERVRGDYSAQVSAAAAIEEANGPGDDTDETTPPLLAAARRTSALARDYDRLKNELVRLGHRDLVGLDRIDPIDRDGIAALLEPGDRFLELFLLDGRAVGILVGPDRSVIAADCGEEVALRETIVEEWHADMTDLGLLDAGAKGRHMGAFLDAATEMLDRLGDAILSPFEAQLRGVKRLILAPHGVLHALPIPALRLNGEHLVETLEPIVVPSASVLRTISGRRRLERGSGGGRPLVISASDGDAPEIGAEARRVAAMLPGARLVEGRNATVAAFREKAPHAGLLHLASHGEFTEGSPMASALRLSDGLLRAADLYGISVGAPLVVLSGCETGRSLARPGDELLGFLRGFLFAGAEAIVASIWRVDDAASAQLMELFYGALAQGCTVGGALRHAQRRMARRYSHPYFWAGFCAFGRGGASAPSGAAQE